MHITAASEFTMKSKVPGRLSSCTTAAPRSGADWRDLGYVDALKHDYKLILIDARGAGASDKPHDAAAYDPALRASDVVAVLDDLGIRHAHYFGYSLGGWVGFLLAKYAPDRSHP